MLFGAEIVKIEWTKPVVREIKAPVDVIRTMQAEIEAAHDARIKACITIVPARALPGGPHVAGLAGDG